jgi:PIN domain nuclease of toxin-antitoxin system
LRSDTGNLALNKVVLDASALLALLNQEPGRQKVEEVIPGAAISAVNLSEVIAKLSEAGVPEEPLRTALDSAGLEVHSFDVESAYLAGSLRVRTRKLGLSFGDRACIALGHQLGAPVLTADRSWKELDAGVEVRVIR